LSTPQYPPGSHTSSRSRSPCCSAATAADGRRGRPGRPTRHRGQARPKRTPSASARAEQPQPSPASVLPRPGRPRWRADVRHAPVAPRTRSLGPPGSYFVLDPPARRGHRRSGNRAWLRGPGRAALLLDDGTANAFAPRSPADKAVGALDSGGVTTDRRTLSVVFFSPTAGARRRTCPRHRALPPHPRPRTRPGPSAHRAGRCCAAPAS
jgi:hypothetical protein